MSIIQRRVGLVIISAFLLPLSLAACREGRTGLPPEEVLRRAAQAGQELASAAYTLSGDFAMRRGGATVAEGDGTIDGRLQDGGAQMQFVLEGALRLPQEKPVHVTGKLEVIVAGEDELYLRIHELRDQPEGSVLKAELLRGFLDGWWLLPMPASDTGATVASAVTPHPRILHAQAQVVQVVEDYGITKLRGRDVYHYDVMIDPAKLIAYLREVARERGEDVADAAYTPLAELKAEGELWIDAETFFVQALRWDIPSFPLEDGGVLALSFDANLRDHGSAAPITPPDDARPFSLVALPAGALKALAPPASQAKIR